MKDSRRALRSASRTRALGMKRIRSDIGEDFAYRSAIYDALLARGEKEPAVVRWGDRMIIGRWVPTARVRPDSTTKEFVFRSAIRAVQVIAEGATWPEAAKAARIEIA